MRKRLTRHGNSLALIIDRPILDLLGIDREGELEITTNGKVLVLTPVRQTDEPDAGRDSGVDPVVWRLGNW